MSNIVISVNQAAQISQSLREAGKRIVLTGGCFDLLHVGHIKLLEKAKEAGDVLLVLLESDKKIAESKGNHRPIHTQEERAYILSSIRFIDYVICLPYFSSNGEYDNVVTKIHPSIIAVTEGDRGIEHKQRQAKSVDASISEVITYIPNKSTSASLKALLEEK
ncbi:MAG: adenylyltransferase/cytidyltransferase family protein [Patescibacteria group bacterium]|nr:adenylyltransferase/cytidyltransferase family protein [Patescibacteria group bacterium]MDE2589212.1 adenylyltransferase/cytidyltransferase family protein [Patescibacteria group bacterium]